MSEPQSSNLSSLAHLAAVLRPAFRCPTTQKAVQDLYTEVVDAAGGNTTLEASEAALRAVILDRFAGYDPNRLSPALRSFLETLKNGG